MIKPQNLLIVRTDRIGDVVLTLPLAEILKKYFPACKITFLIREYTRSIVEGNPFIDEVLILQENEGRPLIRENIKKISVQNFDSCIIVYPTFSLALIIYLTQIKNIVGTGYRWYSFFFNHKVFQHRKYAEMHELEFNIKLLEVFGIKEKIDKNDVNFNLIVKENQKVNEFVKRAIKEDKKLVIIHPGSGGSAVDLPVEKFKELVLMLNERNDIDFRQKATMPRLEYHRTTSTSLGSFVSRPNSSKVLSNSMLKASTRNTQRRILIKK